jgi:hypothetical protein
VRGDPQQRFPFGGPGWGGPLAVHEEDLAGFDGDDVREAFGGCGADGVVAVGAEVVDDGVFDSDAVAVGAHAAVRRAVEEPVLEDAGDECGEGTTRQPAEDGEGVVGGHPASRMTCCSQGQLWGQVSACRGLGPAVAA